MRVRALTNETAAARIYNNSFAPSLMSTATTTTTTTPTNNGTAETAMHAVLTLVVVWKTHSRNTINIYIKYTPLFVANIYLFSPSLYK